MKIRASITNYYDKLFNDGAQYYSYNGTLDMWAGNPTKDRKVLKYMHSLKKRKAQSGETANSVRAITREDMMALYDHCTKTGTAVSIRQFAIYVFAFLGLLRIDEALTLQLINVEYNDRYITLTLDHRKDAPGGSKLNIIWGLSIC
jgi:hypothetical protein